MDCHAQSLCGVEASNRYWELLNKLHTAAPGRECKVGELGTEKRKVYFKRVR